MLPLYLVGCNIRSGVACDMLNLFIYFLCVGLAMEDGLDVLFCDSLPTVVPLTFFPSV